MIGASVERRKPDAIIDDVIETHRRYKRDLNKGYYRFGVETVQFQYFFKDVMAAKALEAGEYIPIEEIQSIAKEVHESGDVSGQNAVSQNSAVSDREADSISENNAAASDRTGSIDTRSVTKSGQKSENGAESPAFDFSAQGG